MEIKVNPNRMVLLQLKKRKSMAVRGHKLLKDKQDELMRKFLEFIEHYKELREKIDSLLAKGYGKFLGARAVMSPDELELATQSPPNQLQIEAKEMRIMNTKVPILKMVHLGEHFNYSPLSTSASLDVALDHFANILPELIKLAEFEKRIEVLAAELERTRRRVNALEYVLIPSLEETIRKITMKLSENERATISRLMKIKDIVREH